MSEGRERLNVLQCEYEELLAQKSPKSYDLAKLETTIWDTRKEVMGIGVLKKGGQRREWFADNFGTSSAACEVRFTIFRAGEWAHMLFERVDNNHIKLNASKLVVHRAKQLARQHDVAPAKALAAIIAQYDGSSNSIKFAELQFRTQKSEPPETTAIGSAKGFKTRTLRAAKAFMEEHTEGYDVEPVHKRKIFEEFEVSLGRVISDYLSDITAKKGDARRSKLQNIGAVRFNQACEVIGINAKFGAVLRMDTVRRAYRRRAAPLQRMVDAGNSDAAQKELRAVNDAYELLQTYSKQKGPK